MKLAIIKCHITIACSRTRQSRAADVKRYGVTTVNQTQEFDNNER